MTAAGLRLRVAQPSVSSQIRKLERTVGSKLFERAGRGIQLTPTGREIYRLADEIFSAGQDLVDHLEGRPSGRPLRLNVGVPDIMPKLITYRLLAPVFALEQEIEIVCHESNFEALLADLAIRRFQVILSDAPVSSRVQVKAFNHLLGECGITIFAIAELNQKYGPSFPESLEGAPMLLPTTDTELRQSMDQWLDRHNIHPKIVGQFYDSALLKEFGHAGIGLFPAPTAIEREIRQQYQVEVVGRIDDIREKFYAITLQRKLKHPGVIAIAEAAKNELLK